MFRTNVGKARAKGIFRIYLRNMAANVEEGEFMGAVSVPGDNTHKCAVPRFVCSL